MVLALVVAACGDDDDDDAATEDTGEATATTEAAPATTSAATEAPETTEAAPATTEAAPEATEAPVATEAPEPQTIQVGFAWPDLSAFVQVSEAYGVGDPEQQMLAVIEGWRQDGTLPINGVDIELVSQSFDSLDSETKLAACQKFGTEGEIFAVLGGRIFTDGAECLATRSRSR
jgi:hypothetical protein